MHSLQRISAHGEWQFAPRVYPNGMVLPACRVEVRSSGKTKCIVSAFVLETAEFYEQLPPDAFVVSVPAGVNALDWRQVPDTGLRRPEGGVVRGPVPDVVAYLNARSGHSPIKPVLTYGQPAPAVHPAKWLSQAGEIPPPETKDKVVLIDFWGIGCGPCVAQLPDVQAAARHFKDTDLVLIGLHESRAEIEQVRQFATDRHLEYVLAIDREPSERGWFGATMQAYGVQGIPAAAVIDRAGKLVYLGELRQALSRAANVLNQK
jgi:thiol-disulfide isomerase/thioredoxin